MRSPAPKNVSRVAVKSAPLRSSVRASAGPSVPVVRPSKRQAKVLFNRFFQSVGPRTYRCELRELENGNHLLVLTEQKRDRESGEERQLRLFVFGEDFHAFFRMLHETAQFIRANPLPPEVRRRRAEFWAKRKKTSQSQRGV
jgi:hypothetical protein